MTFELFFEILIALHCSVGHQELAIERENETLEKKGNFSMHFTYYLTILKIFLVRSLYLMEAEC